MHSKKTDRPAPSGNYSCRFLDIPPLRNTSDPLRYTSSAARTTRGHLSTLSEKARGGPAVIT